MKLPLNEAKLIQFNGMEGALEVSGEIIRVVDKLSGEGEFGAWSFQKVHIKDEEGEAVLSLKNREETLDKSDVGTFITICSNETKKGGHKGVKVENRDFKKKDGTTASALEIVVTGHATVEMSGVKDGAAKKTVSRMTPPPSRTTSSVQIAATPEEMAEAKVKHDEEELAKWECLKQLRKETIQETFTYWMLTLMESKVEITPEIYAAMIRVCGPNADTLMLSKLGGRK